jgi:hypothetical protein
MLGWAPEWNPIDDLVRESQEAWNSTRGARESVGGWVQRNGSIEGLDNLNDEFVESWNPTRCNTWVDVGADAGGLIAGVYPYGVMSFMNSLSCAIYGY